jgi:proteic killer suppression protein
MQVEFADEDLDRLDTDPSFSRGLSPGVVTAYRKRLQGIRSVSDERDLYAMKSWRFEKLKGQKQHQHSMRLNDRFRLILEIVGTGREKRLRIVGIEDYH